MSVRCTRRERRISDRQRQRRCALVSPSSGKQCSVTPSEVCTLDAARWLRSICRALTLQVRSRHIPRDLNLAFMPLPCAVADRLLLSPSHHHTTFRSYSSRQYRPQPTSATPRWSDEAALHMTPCAEPLHPLLQTANGATPEQLRRQAFVESLASGVMAALLIALACTLFLRSAPFQYMMAALRSALAGGAAGAGLESGTHLQPLLAGFVIGVAPH